MNPIATPLAPQAALAAGVLGALGLGLFRRPGAVWSRAFAVTTLFGALLALLVAPGGAVPPLVWVDRISLGWQLVIYAGALPLAFCAAGDDVETALFLGATLGMGLLCVAGNLPMLFVGLEFMSLPAYLLVERAGTGARGPRLEAALKYFFAGALAGALFLLGLALYYAQTGLLGPGAGPLGPMGRAGVSLMAAAALFKIGAVPLHWWLPDVYGASAPEVSGFLSTSMKAAATLFLVRVIQIAPDPMFAAVLPWLGAVTALVGALLALRQERLQRLLAYSSLSHAGLLILGVGAWARLGGDKQALASLLFYLAAYALMSNGAFLFLSASGLETRGQLRGYASRAAGPAGAFAVLLFALGGVPPTGGFLAKLLIFWQALRAGLAAPTALAAVASIVSLGYYLGLVRDMYFEAPEGAAVPVPANVETPRYILLVCAIGALLLGAAPLVYRGLSGGLWK
jgi:NADH-quinone oxidoreductase subunit N